MKKTFPYYVRNQVLLLRIIRKRILYSRVLQIFFPNIIAIYLLLQVQERKEHILRSIMKEKNTCKQYSIFDLQSETIRFLRFPLIVGVVMSHAKLSDINTGGFYNIDDSTMCLFNYISYLISDILARIPQPMFFFFSGLLFFRNVSSFNRNIYLQKLSRRVHSLLIPYVVWNLLIVLLYLAVQLVVPELLSGHNKPVADYSATDWLWAFWDTSMINSQAFESMPINYPLWFVRDLMVTVLFTPLIYLLIKKLKIVFLCVLGILWLFNFSVGITGFSFAAFFFFSLGAYFHHIQKEFHRYYKSFNNSYSNILCCNSCHAIVFQHIRRRQDNISAKCRTFRRHGGGFWNNIPIRCKRRTNRESYCKQLQLLPVCLSQYAVIVYIAFIAENRSASRKCFRPAGLFYFTGYYYSSRNTAL